jgi:hypothetical protein
MQACGDYLDTAPIRRSPVAGLTSDLGDEKHICEDLELAESLEGGMRIHVRRPGAYPRR